MRASYDDAVPLTVVVAPDSFKGSIDAAAAAAAIATGWSTVRSSDRLVLLPQADGGEGTLTVVQSAVGAGRRHTVRVTGPDGRPVFAGWLQLPDGSALVELAQSSALTQMLKPDAMGASTRGLGEVIVQAVAASPRRLSPTSACC